MHVTGKPKKTLMGKKDEQKQFETLMKVMDNHSLIQVIQESTRGVNTLNLVFTNNPEMFTQFT